MNIKACKEISELNVVEEMIVVPSASDESLPFGALYKINKLNKQKTSIVKNLYLGISYEKEIDKFVNSANWEFYVNACRSYGFMVDRFIPWRLVADIGVYPTVSPIIEYASKYGLSTTDQILTLGYGYAHSSFYGNFEQFLLNLYNKVKLKSFREIKRCDGKTKSVKVTPQTYTTAQLSKIYSAEYFLKLYFEIRFIEEESQFKDFEKEMLMDDCIELYQHSTVSAALEVFERILNKTFDYRGSLSYIKERLEAVRTASATSTITTGTGGY